MVRFTRWILAHKPLVVGFWIIVALAGFASAQNATNALSAKFSNPGKEGYETNVAILRTYGSGGVNLPLVPSITLPSGTTVDSPGIKGQLVAAFARMAASVPHSRAVSYGSTGNRAFVSHDGRTTFALVYIPMPPGFGDVNIYRPVQDVARTATVAGAHFHVTGILPLSFNTGGGSGPGVFAEALLGGIGALFILIFVFRSFMALVPLAMAIVAIPTTFLLVWGLTAITDISFIVQFLVALIGLGVAIDYALIIVLRWREERLQGQSNEAAVVRAMDTAGTAVVFSGTTVAVGLLALVVLPLPFLRSVGYGGLLIPLVTVVVAITLLPVVLATIGPRLDWPRFGQRKEAGAFWTGWARMVVRFPWVAALAAGLVLAALIVATTTISLGETKADALSKSGDAYQGLRALETSGIGAGVLTPMEILVRGTAPSGVATQLAGLPGVRGAVAPSSPAWNRAGNSLVEVLPSHEASTSGAATTLDAVRNIAHAHAGSVRVGGDAAESADFVSAVYGNFPLMIALIVLLTFLLLVRAFRSLLLPLKAVLLNILSIGAAWGFMVLVWQNGYGSKEIWGIQSTGAITAWVPLMVFAFLFGLSMDYEVFILSRMREEYDAGGSTRGAVVTGIGRTGRLVTSAALILGFAFIALASGPQTDIKVLGTGLAAGILIDATIIRMLLVPALITLFGRWNWWLPAGPARLLRVQPSIPHLERTTAPSPAAK